jgi:hypothetical protein
MRPPIITTRPIFTSTLPRRQCASTPDTDEATIWFASVPTATAGGTPMKISSGVIRKPPPTPNRPERNPTAPPMPRMRNTFTDISAMGR